MRGVVAKKEEEQEQEEAEGTIASTDENFRDFGWFLKWDEDFLWKRFHENLDEVCI